MYARAVADAVLPLSVPITGIDGTLMHSITVPKGTSIYLGTVAANLNTEVWGEDALQFCSTMKAAMSVPPSFSTNSTVIQVNTVPT
jgi:hypothetical protein